ncbi:extracellular solute-binding protein [Nocardiopsis sp. RSe5-2]|uniref:Extracellular solute-binding protein n=1 Tax=Nocardiopsis endophytica TaxID=3018445 RepID=A0ABT4U8F2_9ACTN|nr:extracellular solute-binding protein [Nocardiopsis endophytica]MDA2813236.1 extracellular solute-binding protein [Nocardiopsis endophytica]
MPSATGRALAGTASAACALTLLSACGTSADGGDTTSDGKVRLDVNGRPPTTQAFERELFDEHVQRFEEANPDIDIVPHEGFMDPQTFSAKLAGGKLEDVFYVYFTDARSLIERGQAADITDAVQDMPHREDVQDGLMEVFQDADGRQFGLPTANYSMGLLYNRELFEEAGLDPDDPPATWEEVREAADAVSGLGEGTVGYADFSKGNQGGWHFTAELYSRGGRIAEEADGGWKAAFNTDDGRDVLQTLHDMRFEDGSMGGRQLLEAEDAQRMMGAGELGMYIAAADNISTIAKQFGGRYEDYGLAPMPGEGATLLGGEGYMVNPGATPEQVEAGVRWIQWKYLNPETIERDVVAHVENDLPVGLPMPPTPDIWKGGVRERIEGVKEANANVPMDNYAGYMEAAPEMEGVIEPPQAQEVYAVLDSVMQAVLTDEDADIDRLLDDAEEKVDGVYSGS